MSACAFPVTRFSVAAAILMATAHPAAAREPGTRVVGYLENAIVYPGGFRLEAKMDTGARTTSIHAPDAAMFTRDGKRWVRFTLRFHGKSMVVERPVVRISRIRRTMVGQVERPVVRLGICIAGYYKDAEVNLTNRKGMNYPLLIGRLYMRTGGIVIDSGKKFRSKTTCPNSPSGGQ